MKPISTGKIIWLVILAVAIIGVLWTMSSYNSLVSLQENVKTAQADVEVQYQRRFDLIPNLVQTVQGIANLEKGIFKDLADARARYSGAPSGSPEKLNALNGLENAVGRLLVVVENYPQIKSSESFQKLQDQLEGTENRIGVARNDYNGVVNEYNKKVRLFPSTLIARLFGFEEKPRFEAKAEAETAPKVQFDFK